MVECGLMWLASFTIVFFLFAFWYEMLGFIACYCSFCSLVCKCEIQRTELWTMFTCPSFLNILIAYFNLLSQSHCCSSNVVGFYLEGIQFECWSRYCPDWGFFLSSSVSPTKCWDSTLMCQWPLSPSKSLPFDHASLFLPSILCNLRHWQCHKITKKQNSEPVEQFSQNVVWTVCYWKWTQCILCK
jgi:hypothetical protein